jgi:hypothetical protein
MFFLAWVFINQTIYFIVFNFDFGVEINTVAKMNHKLMVDENVNNKNNIIINYWANNILLHNDQHWAFNFWKMFVGTYTRRKKNKINQKNLQIKGMTQNQKDKIEIYYLK